MQPTSIPDGTKVTMASHELIFGQTIYQPRDANDILNDVTALRARMADDGYLLIRNFHEREAVLAARAEILNHLAQQGFLKPGTPVEAGIIGPQNRGTVLPNNVVVKLPAYLRLVDGARIMTFFEQFLGGSVLTLDHKWPRAVKHGAATGAHYDIVYMGSGTPNLYTVWTPLDDVTLDMGPLAICPGSNHIERLKQTYGRADAHNDLTDGWLGRDPHELRQSLGVEWASTSFQAGDVVIFGMFFLHGSLDNVSDRYRLSTDNRYQLAHEAVDERHMGPNPDQIPKRTGRKSMAEMRTKWGI